MGDKRADPAPPPAPTPQVITVDNSVITGAFLVTYTEATTIVTEYVTYAATNGTYNGIFVAAGGPVSVAPGPSVENPPTTTSNPAAEGGSSVSLTPAPSVSATGPVASGPTASSATQVVLSIAANSTSPSSTPTSATRTIVTETDLYVFWATYFTATTTNGTKTAPYVTYSSVSTPSTSLMATYDKNGLPTKQAVLVTPSYVYSQGKDGTWTPTATSQVSVGTPFPTHGAHKSSGISKGAGAGIGVGCAIAGALIAFLLAWLCIRRRSKSKRYAQGGRYSNRPSSGYAMSDAKNPIVTSAGIVEMPQESRAAIVRSKAPQPRGDDDIRNDFSHLRTRIENYVNHYHLSGGSDKPAIDAFQSAFGEDSPVPLRKLSASLSDSRLRPQVLKAAIAWIVTQRFLLTAPPSESFLPPDIAGAHESFSNNSLDEETRAAFLTEWRVTTATMSNWLYGQELIGPNDVRLVNIQNAVRQADSFLMHLTNSTNPNRLVTLEEIMKRGARVGWMLFSQATEFTTDWTEEGRGTVVFPALLQITDENGRLKRPRSFGDKQSVQL